MSEKNYTHNYMLYEGNHLHPGIVVIFIIMTLFAFAFVPFSIYVTYCRLNGITNWIESGFGVVATAFLMASWLLTMAFGTEGSPAFLFGYATHLILPWKKAERVIEIQAYLEVNRIPTLTNSQKPTPRPRNRKEFLDTDRFESITAYNLADWIKLYVGPEKGLVKVINERVFGVTPERKGILYWSQMIPKENLSADDYRILLLTSPIVEESDITDLNAISIKEVDSIFVAYSSEELKRIFTTAFRLKEYINILNICVSYSLALPVFKDMKEANLWANEIEASILGQVYSFPQDKNWILKLEQTTTSLGKIKFISNVGELSIWATRMKNCIKSYQNQAANGKTYLFGISVLGEPVIVFELNKEGYLVEAKRKANTALSSGEKYELAKVIVSAVQQY